MKNSGSCPILITFFTLLEIFCPTMQIQISLRQGINQKSGKQFFRSHAFFLIPNYQILTRTLKTYIQDHFWCFFGPFWVIQNFFQTIRITNFSLQINHLRNMLQTEVKLFKSYTLQESITSLLLNMMLRIVRILISSQNGNRFLIFVFIFFFYLFFFLYIPESLLCFVSFSFNILNLT